MPTLHRITCAALAALVLGGCASGADETAESVDAAAPAANADTALLSARTVEIGGFETVAVEPAPWQDAWHAPGRLMLDPAATRPLGAIVEGRITRVFVQPGDRVRAGQVLAAIHSHEMLDANAELARARSALTRAEAELRVATDAAARAERLHGIKALSLAALERARAEKVAAEAARDQAAAELERAAEMHAHLAGEGPVPDGVSPHEALVRSPIDGVVVSRDAEPGAVVLVGSPLVTVSRLSSLALSIRLPEEALGAARVGTPVRFTSAAFPGRTFEGTVFRVAPMLDTLTRTVEVVARVPNPDGALRPEMFVDAELAGDAGAPTLAVPADALQLLEGDTVVIAARPRGDGLLIEAVRVTTGRRSAGAVEVLAGLDPGRAVIVRGAATAKAEILERRGGGE